jgi:RNA polymerase sigma-70 factor (ECF subfamily)
MVAAAVMRNETTESHEALRVLFEKYKDRVYSVALHFFGGDEALAKDITSQVFLKLVDRLGQFRHQADEATWLYRITANACLDEMRKRRRLVFFGHASEITREASVSITGEHRIEREETARAVQAAVAQLSPKLRLVILLRYFDELPYERLAEALNCSPGTVASRLNRAHKALAEKLAHLRGALSGS